MFKIGAVICSFAFACSATFADQVPIFSPAEGKTPALCFDSQVLEPGLVLTGYVSNLEREYPDSVEKNEKVICVLAGSLSGAPAIPAESFEQVQLMLQQLPSAVVERADARAAERLSVVAGAAGAPGAAGKAATPVAPKAPDFWKGLPKDLGVITAAGGVAFAILYFSPHSFSQWDRDEVGFDLWWKNVSRPPVWDHDKWYINYVAHPVVGMQTYLMQRNRGQTWLTSFLFSTAASVAWEYTIEAVAERPSAQDLLFTSTIGSLLGEMSYQATQLMRKNGFNTAEKVVVTIINPGWVIDHGYH